MGPSNSRPPAVAGLFYPSDKEELLSSIKRAFLGNLGPGSFPGKIESEPTETSGSIECFIVPHAGYVYSGQIAAHSYFRASKLLGRIKGELTVVIFGPNHYGVGSGVALSPSLSWSTPLGDLQLNRDLSTRILAKCTIADSDATAHSREHSIEVQVPFIQRTLANNRKASMVPICLMLQDLETMKEIAEGVMSAIRQTQGTGPILILGSSDLTHYEMREEATMKDHKLLSAMESLDVYEYYSTLEKNNVSACGYGAIAAVMIIAKELGKKRGELLKYATSGDVTGEYLSVVGYSAMHFS